MSDGIAAAQQRLPSARASPWPLLVIVRGSVDQRLSPCLPSPSIKCADSGRVEAASQLRFVDSSCVCPSRPAEMRGCARWRLAPGNTLFRACGRLRPAFRCMLCKGSGLQARVLCPASTPFVIPYSRKACLQAVPSVVAVVAVFRDCTSCVPPSPVDSRPAARRPFACCFEPVCYHPPTFRRVRHAPMHSWEPAAAPAPSHPFLHSRHKPHAKCSFIMHDPSNAACRR
jgi:hypothetical protein